MLCTSESCSFLPVFPVLWKSTKRQISQAATGKTAALESKNYSIEKDLLKLDQKQRNICMWNLKFLSLVTSVWLNAFLACTVKLYSSVTFLLKSLTLFLQPQVVYRRVPGDCPHRDKSCKKPFSICFFSFSPSVQGCKQCSVGYPALSRGTSRNQGCSTPRQGRDADSTGAASLPHTSCNTAHPAVTHPSLLQATQNLGNP